MNNTIAGLASVIGELPAQAANLPALVEIPGSRELRNKRHEMFARLRAQLRPKADAYRRAFEVPDDYAPHAARGNASKVERRPEVFARIAYLSRQDEELIAAKRQRLEEMLWLIHEANVAEMWHTVEVLTYDRKGNAILNEDGTPATKRVQRPRAVEELSEDTQRAIEAITINEAGFVVPKPYSKLQANIELRKLLNIGPPTRDADGEMLRLSDADLVAQLAAQARELGIEIDLSYRFGGE